MNEYSLEDYIRYRLNRANEIIEEAKLFIENGFWNGAISRLYYACFYAVGALLLKNGVTTTTHAGSRQKFGQLFILTGLISKEMGKVYKDLFDMRQKGDYDDFFDFNKEQVLILLQPAIDFVAEVRRIINS